MKLHRIITVCAIIPLSCYGQDTFSSDTATVNKWNRHSKQLAPTNQSVSEAYADSAIHVSKEINYQIGYGDGVNNLGLANDYAGNFEKAIKLYSDAVAIYDQCNYHRGKGSALNNLGIVYSSLGDYDKSVEYYLESIKYFEKVGYLKGIASTLNNLGVISRKKGEYSKALGYYEASIDYKLKMGDNEGVMVTNSNMSAIYVYLKDWEKALEYNDRSLAIAYEIGNNDQKAECLVQKGFILNGMNRNKEAIESYRKAEPILLDRNLYSTLIISYTGIGSLYLEENKLDSAQYYLENALVLLGSQENVNTRIEVLNGLALVHERQGKYDKSLDYLKQFIALKDSIHDSSKSEDVKELEAKYNYLSQKNKISDLKKKNEIDELNQRYLIIAFVVLLFILLYFFYLARKLKRQKEVVATALNDKDLLLKEIHHRVKNNLQMVSSLLYLQSDYIKDTKALDAIANSRTRVESMAIIHQKLYKEDDITGIATTDYIDDLVEGIFETLQLDEGSVEIVKEIEPLSLDIDTTIPIGLILNELITNSLKHAFLSSQQDKQIHIGLKQEADSLMLYVKDNGTGKALVNANHSDGFGQKLIDMLAKQLRADVQIENNQGYSVQMSIKRYKLH